MEWSRVQVWFPRVSTSGGQSEGICEEAAAAEAEAVWEVNEEG